MSKSIFISVVHEDSHRMEAIKNWATQKLLGDVVITHETEDKRPQGKEEIRKHLQNKINGAAIVVVLIGQDTHNHNWIEVEVELANSYHKNIICMRVPNTNGNVPLILSKYKLISFHPDSLKKELDSIK